MTTFEVPASGHTIGLVLAQIAGLRESLDVPSIVRGLIAILLTLFSGHTPREILGTDALAVFDEFGFREHLTPQRSNGLRAMVERIRADAREALAEAS